MLSTASPMASSPSRAGVTGFLLENKDTSAVALRLLRADHAYGELISVTNQIANHLRTIGLKYGDRVILLGDHSFFWVSTYLGIMRAGMVAVPLPPTLAAADVAEILQVTEAKAVCCERVAMARHNHIFANVKVICDRAPAATREDDASVDVFEEVQRMAHPSDADLPSIDESDLAALMFTSGSTGTPRGVMVSHRNLIANTEAIVEYLELTEKDRIMAVLPFHYCFGASLLHTHLRAGGTVVVDSRFMYPELVLQRMLETECTGFAGVPSHFQILIRNSSLTRRQFPDLRYVQQAGGHLAPAVIRELQNALPSTRIFVMYGQTEATARLSYLPPELLERKPGSIGKGIPGVKLAVQDDNGEVVQPGAVGEIVAEGASITLGYWRNPRDTATVFRNGKLHTGDLATVDEEGFVYIVERKTDFIKCRGERVSCRSIEDIVLQMPQLVEAAVVGTPDEILGEAVKLFVVPHEGVASGIDQRITTFCKERLPAHLRPKEISVLSNLPKNGAGKVLKLQLRAGQPAQS